MDYKSRCRTCLGQEKEMRHIHSTVRISGSDIHLSDILQNFYNYKMASEPLFPENICISCVHQLTITYSFKLLIEASSKTILDNLNHVDSNNDNYDVGFESDDQKPIRHMKIKKRNIQKLELIEDEMILLFCVECKAEFHSVKSLNEHCSNHHPSKSIVGRDCEYCHEKFEDFRSLVLHRKLHLKPYLCENCWEGFYSGDELSSHSCRPNIDNKEKHKPDRLMRQCDQCGKSYPPGYIRIHMLTHSDDRQYSCKYCPKKFKVPGGLHSHILWNHKRTRNHKCEVCNATFISSSSRSSHIRKNHLKEKKYCCDSCGKRFFSKSELERHSLTHTGVKNFHCHLCDKSYQTRYGLNVHLKSHTQIIEFGN